MLQQRVSCFGAAAAVENVEKLLSTDESLSYFVLVVKLVVNVACEWKLVIYLSVRD